MPSFYYGTAGWHYEDWKGIVYPRRVPRGWHALPFLARYVNLVEVNATFYAPLRADMAAAWVRHLKPWPDFRLVVKAWARFTHTRDAFPSPDEVALWSRVLDPLLEAGRLLAVLVQFPPSVRDRPAARERLLRIRDVLPEVQVATEFRHRSWIHDEPLEFLGREGFAFVNIDQPQGRDTIPPTALKTAPLSYVRLHGRNAAAWFSREAGRDERYDYSYGAQELAEWAERTHHLLRTSAVTLVVGNNHYQGKALAAVLSLAHAITGKKVAVPGELLEHYPELVPLSRPEPGSLF